MSFIFGKDRGSRRSSQVTRHHSLHRVRKANSSPQRVRHIVPAMSDDALYSVRGVRFKETIVTTTNRTRGDIRWYSPQASPDPAVSGPLATFSFLLPEKVERISYKEQQQNYINAFENCPLFKDGLLLDAREKGVMFPVVHLSHEGLLSTKKDELIPNGFTLHQGVYQEVRNIVPETELPEVAPVPQDQRNIRYILMGFKSLDRNFSQVMVDTWKDWTGARYIYMYLPDDLGLRKITFYHRQQPDHLEFFMYLVVVECHGVTTREKQIRLLDFAQRMRLERMTGYISVYSGERKGQNLLPSPIESIPRKIDIFDSFLTNTLIPRNTRV